MCLAPTVGEWLSLRNKRKMRTHRDTLLTDLEFLTNECLARSIPITENSCWKITQSSGIYRRCFFACHWIIILWQAVPPELEGLTVKPTAWFKSSQMPETKDITIVPVLRNTLFYRFLCVGWNVECLAVVSLRITE